mmetsp:Transcript_9817/g.16310  ORF Transcript_9817/g.16310 Transcript_9817/m.16310 type:complete len:724 (+) Transcript_9817:115-2286(+)
MNTSENYKEQNGLLSPEKPSMPKPSSKSPRSKVDTKSSPNRWLIAASKLQEMKKVPKELLMKRHEVVSAQITKDHQAQLADVSEDATKELSEAERAARIKSNEDINQRLTNELLIQTKIHKMAIRLVIQYDITTEEAASLAETEVREEVSLSNQVNKHAVQESEGLEDDVQLHVRRLEDAYDDNNQQRGDTAATVDSTDHLFASLFDKEVEKEKVVEPDGRGDLQADTDHGKDSLSHSGLKPATGSDDEKINTAAALLLLEEDISQNEALEKAREQVNESSHYEDKDTSSHGDSLSVPTTLNTSHPLTQQSVQPKKSPSAAKRKFTNAVFKVVDQNRAKREAYKSLAKAAMLKTNPGGTLAMNSTSDDESEERRKEASGSLTQPLGAKKVPPRHSMWVTAVNKVVEDNRAKRAAFLSLSKASLQKTELSRNAVNMPLEKTQSEDDPWKLSRQASSSNPILNRVMSNVSSSGRSNKLSRDRTAESDSMTMTMQGMYEKAYDSALESTRVTSAQEKKSDKKREKKQNKKLAKLVQATHETSTISLQQAKRNQDMMIRETEVQEDIYQSEIALKNASAYMSKTAPVVVDSINKMNKHDLAVKRLLEAADGIRKRKEANDEETKYRLLQEEEDKLKLSEKRKVAYFAEWHKIQKEISALREDVATKNNSQMQEELNSSAYFKELRTQGLQDKIAEEVSKMLAREEQREGRAAQRLQNMEEQVQAQFS